MFLPNWSVKVEYAYYDLGSVTYNSGPLVTTPNGGGATSFINTAATRIHFNGNIVRAGYQLPLQLGRAGSGRRQILKPAIGKLFVGKIKPGLAAGFFHEV